MGLICSSNPLVKPLTKFHSTINSSFNKLPSQGKILEIAKRVVIIAIAPFAYLALGVLALAGLALKCFFKNRDPKNISNDSPHRGIENFSNNPIQSKQPLFSVVSECDKIKKQIISTIDAAKEINQLQSAKILLDIECNDKKFSKDHVIKRVDTLLSARVFIAGILDAIFTEAKEFLQIQNAEKINFRWIAFLKDNEGMFSKAEGFLECSNDEGECRSRDGQDINRNIDSNRLENYWNLVLKRNRREIKPQLDHQLNFV